MNDWPECVPVIDPAELEVYPHHYSTHPQSIPGLWAMFRKVFPKSLISSYLIPALSLAVHTDLGIPTNSPFRLSSRSTERRAALFNLTCSILGYTDGQSSLTLQLTEIAHARRTHCSSIRPTNPHRPRRRSARNPAVQSTHEECHTHSDDGQVLPIRPLGTPSRPRPRRPNKPISTGD
jgi:hypothetical protein